MLTNQEYFADFLQIRGEYYFGKPLSYPGSTIFLSD